MKVEPLHEQKGAPFRSDEDIETPFVGGLVTQTNYEEGIG